MATAPRVPTIDEIAAGLISAWETAFGIVIHLLPKSFLAVSARVLAAVYVTLFKYAAYIFLQQYAEVADLEETEILGRTVRPLEALAAERGIGAPDPATQAELTADVTVLVLSGTIQPGEQLLGQDNGVTYLVQDPVPLVSSPVTIRVIAAADQAGGNGAGVIGNLPVGSVLAFANPRENVAREAVVAAILTTATDGETEEAYRERVLDAYQKQPEGGAPADYERWAEAVPGIIRAYPYKGDPGVIKIYLEADPVSSGSPDGIPTLSQQQDTLDAVDAVNPLSDFLAVYPISRTLFGLRVLGLAAANLAECKTAIEDAAAALYAGFEPYIPGLAVGARRDAVTEGEATATVSGVIRTFDGVYTAIIQEQAGVHDPYYVLGEGEKAKVTVSYV